jgi:hypothetical protein
MVEFGSAVSGQFLKQQTVDDEYLTTIMCEVESIMNSRPLTKVSDDSNDLEALTPNHLLLLQTSMETGSIPI